MEKIIKKSLHFLTAILDVYRDKEDRELDTLDKLEPGDEAAEDLTALMLALHVAMMELTEFDGDLIDTTYALNKLAVQYLMENGAEVV